MQGSSFLQLEFNRKEEGKFQLIKKAWSPGCQQTAVLHHSALARPRTQSFISPLSFLWISLAVSAKGLVFGDTFHGFCWGLCCCSQPARGDNSASAASRGHRPLQVRLCRAGIADTDSWEQLQLPLLLGKGKKKVSLSLFHLFLTSFIRADFSPCFFSLF